MCTVSMVSDHFREWTVPNQHPWVTIPITNPPSYVTREEFDALKAEMESLKELLKRAKQYDIDNDEPNCEIDEKMEFIRKAAELVGIDMDDVLGKNNG